MKSMNCGTPASVALPLRSSRGMIRSTRIVTVAYSCAVKNFGLNVVPGGFAPAAGADCCARAAACSASAGVHEHRRGGCGPEDLERLSSRDSPHGFFVFFVILVVPIVVVLTG